MKTNYQAGEVLTAAELNSIITAILQNSHNIDELYMENYLASKNTPSQGIWFDAFSDTAKTAAGAGTTSGSTAAGQANIVLASSAQANTFAIGEVIQIYDGTNQETKTITNISSATLTVSSNLANTYANGSNVKASTVTVDTANKQLTMTAAIGDLKKTIYQNILTTFQQKMNAIGLWVMRKVTATYTLPGTVAAGGTSTGAIPNATGKFAIGDTVDLVSADKLTRERKTVTNVAEAGGSAVALNGTPTYGTDAAPGDNASYTSNISVTTPAGSSAMIVKIMTENYTYRASTAVTAMTFNGQALTKLGSFRDVNSWGIEFSIWKLINPPIGTFTLAITSAYGGRIAYYAEPLSNCGDVDGWQKATSGTSYTIADTNANDMISDIWYCGLSPTFAGGQTADVVGGINVSGSGFFGTKHAGANGTITMSCTGASQYAAVICRVATPTATVTFTPAVAAAAGFTSADSIERVDALPQLSLATGNISYQTPDYKGSQDVTVDGASFTEDSYSFTPANPANKFKAKIELTRTGTALAPAVKRFAASFNT